MSEPCLRHLTASSTDSWRVVIALLISPRDCSLRTFSSKSDLLLSSQIIHSVRLELLGFGTVSSDLPISISIGKYLDSSNFKFNDLFSKLYGTNEIVNRATTSTTHICKFSKRIAWARSIQNSQIANIAHLEKQPTKCVDYFIL